MAKIGFGRKLWEIFQTAGAGAGLLAFQNVISGVFSSTGRKAGEKLEKKIGEAFGLTSEEALKSDRDDIALAKVLAKGKLLTATQKKEIRVWIGNLQETNIALANELTKRIFNILAETTTEDESTVGTGEKAKKKTFKSDADGILIAESLLLEILEASEEKRLAVLKMNNIKVVPKKLHPKVEKAMEFAKTTLKESFEAAKTQSGEINTSLRENATDLKTNSEIALAKAKAYYEASKKKRS